MKKTTLLLALILISTIGFSQKNDDDYRGRMTVFLAPLKFEYPNPENNPLIDKMSKLESEYMILKVKQVKNKFANKDLTKLKTKDELLKEYIAYLKKKIADEKPKATKADIYGQTRSNRSTGEGIIKREKVVNKKQ
jgi:hypothetical protein